MNRDKASGSTVNEQKEEKESSAQTGGSGIQNSLKRYRKLKRRLVTDGIFAGILGGFLSLAYRWVLSWTDGVRNAVYQDSRGIQILGWVAVCIAAAWIIGKLVQWEPLSSGSGIPQVQAEILGLAEMNPRRILLSKLTGGILGNLAGLSLGREGPSIQIGAAAGKICSRFLKRDSTEENYLISAGAAAGLAAAFNAPLAGTLFTLEEMHKNFSPLLLIPSLIAAVIADFMSKNIFGLQPVFHFEVTGSLPLKYYFIVILGGVLTGVVGVLFIRGLTFFQDAYKATGIKSRYWPMIAILIIVITGFINPALLGGGHVLAEETGKGNMAIGTLAVLLMLKLILTGVSYGSKAQGGIFMPVLVLGGIAGMLIYQIMAAAGFGISGYAANFMIYGMAGILTAVVRSPILSIILVTEMTGSFQHLLPLSIIAVCAYLTAELLKTPPVYEVLLERMLGSHSETAVELKRVIHTFRLPGTSAMVSRKVRDLTLPKSTLLIAIDRSGEEIIPNGETELKAGDEITVVIYSRNISLTRKYLESMDPYDAAE